LVGVTKVWTLQLHFKNHVINIGRRNHRILSAESKKTVGEVCKTVAGGKDTMPGNLA